MVRKYLSDTDLKLVTKDMVGFLWIQITSRYLYSWKPLTHVQIRNSNKVFCLPNWVWTKFFFFWFIGCTWHRLNRCLLMYLQETNQKNKRGTTRKFLFPVLTKRVTDFCPTWLFTIPFPLKVGEFHKIELCFRAGSF